MNNMKNQFLVVSMLLSLGLVASCDSSSGGGSLPPPADETFQVSLVDLDVRRISNGDTVTVDTTGITGEEMMLEN